MTQEPKQLERGRARAQARRVAERSSSPRCTNTVQGYEGRGKGRKRLTVDRICGTATIQNEVERERGVYWCPECATYPWGDGCGPDIVPDEAWPES